MADPKPLTDEERQTQRNKHTPDPRDLPKLICRVCSHRWPCPTVRLLAERDALKKQDEARCRAWAVGMLREEARKAKAAREGLTEHGAQTHSRWMRLHFRETDYVELADEIEQEASDAGA